MRKIIIMTGVVVMAALAVAWSMSTLAKTKIATDGTATEVSAPISPHDIMVRRGKTLPVEYWIDPF